MIGILSAAVKTSKQNKHAQKPHIWLVAALAVQGIRKPRIRDDICKLETNRLGIVSAECNPRELDILLQLPISRRAKVTISRTGIAVRTLDYTQKSLNCMPSSGRNSAEGAGLGDDGSIVIIVRTRENTGTF